jgi:hypothetical protein
MNFKRCAISFALLAVVLGGLALPASAATYKGVFTLPSETVWGSAVLGPGDYTVFAEVFGTTPVFRVEGNGKTVNVLAGNIDFSEPSLQAKGSLEISEVNGTNVITRLNAPAIGREFTFLVPRAVKKGNFPPVALKKVAIPVSSTH